MSLARVIASILIILTMERSSKPRFHDWDMMTWVVTFSFLSKSLITLFLLKMLDSVQKNIGEALAVIVIFLGNIAMGDSTFEMGSFLLVLTVVVLVRIYGQVGQMKPKEQAIPK
jgi:solute carrier family 35 (UDP-sugar transporter), member A1/2/3